MVLDMFKVSLAHLGCQPREPPSLRSTHAVELGVQPAIAQRQRRVSPSETRRRPRVAPRPATAPSFPSHRNIATATASHPLPILNSPPPPLHPQGTSNTIKAQQAAFQAAKKVSGNTHTAAAMPINMVAAFTIMGVGGMLILNTFYKLSYGVGKIDLNKD